MLLQSRISKTELQGLRWGNIIEDSKFKDLCIEPWTEMLLVHSQAVVELIAILAKRLRTACLIRSILCTSTSQWAEVLDRFELPIKLVAPFEATPQWHVLRAQVGQKATAIVFHGLCQDQSLFLVTQSIWRLHAICANGLNPLFPWSKVFQGLHTLL